MAGRGCACVLYNRQVEEQAMFERAMVSLRFQAGKRARKYRGGGVQGGASPNEGYLSRPISPSRTPQPTNQHVIYPSADQSARSLYLASGGGLSLCFQREVEGSSVRGAEAQNAGNRAYKGQVCLYCTRRGPCRTEGTYPSRPIPDQSAGGSFCFV